MAIVIAIYAVLLFCAASWMWCDKACSNNLKVLAGLAMIYSIFLFYVGVRG